ncbi:MAG: galactose mutarotase [Ignavibacteria bacterium]|nr:galactose mutarotase [Ignavibacteria bacterium]MCU7503262.1 galactose mutarotase [Ignavibacteria bacterium]MCU7515792.1 galactose mutarotase [Ignavibacteria bacterium]
MSNLLISLFFSFIFLCANCSGGSLKQTISERPFGKTPDGESVSIYTLTNSKGMQAEITNYGGIVVRLVVPGNNNNLSDVVLGFNTLEEYIKDSPYFGAIVGRYANRIANGRFQIGSEEYKLAINNTPGGIPCHLHGGIKGFDKVVWQAEASEGNNIPRLKLHYLSKDGEEHYPGNLDVTVTYSLTDDNELKIEYLATTDKATPVNLSNHSYFNLKGEGNGDILDHEVMLNAQKFTPVNRGLIPTGELRDVQGTPFDFTKPHKVGERINDKDEQLEYAGGYDHNWVLSTDSAGALKVAATVYEPSAGRFMEILTTQPGVQFYSGNFLDGQIKGKSGMPYEKRSGFCLETQHFPDSPNHPEFPDTILEPGKEFRSTTIYRFSVK